MTKTGDSALPFLYNENMEKQRKAQATIETLQIERDALKLQVAELTVKIKWYEEQFKLSQQRRFGASSEKTATSEQLNLPLFNEAEVEADMRVPEPTEETITVKRKKVTGQREGKLEQLPVEVINYELDPEEQTCSHCGHAIHEMTTEVRQELKIILPEVKVIRHIRHVYACRHCEHEGIQTPIVRAEAPQPVFPKSLASPSTMAYVMSRKYVDGLPLYRQEQDFKRLGIDLSRQTLANWTLYGADHWLTLIYDRMKHHLLKRDILHADESTLQVLREPGRAATSKSYLWLYRSGREGPGIVLYDYQTTRAGKHPARFLSGYKGYLQVDGYAGYNKLTGVTLVGCWAHARRKYAEILKALPPSAQSAGTTAKEGLAFCNQLYAIERELKKEQRSAEERYTIRLKKSKLILQAFSVWLQKQAPRVLPKSALGQAIHYCCEQWDKLNAFLKDGRLELDNNRAERSIKPFVMGRKAWLFANTPKGARSSAIIYSVVETAKENGLNPLNYLIYLFEQLPNMDIQDLSLLDRILPWSETLPENCHTSIK